ncbi:amidase family protein [Jatrophihabitans telluris]|uniref:Amidase family protein n=1 Tax=Jatrophihabitans telluris TaxID=2038343 RepID=A0ABY4QWS4_9ACTN|nr:amidase family protein [Jatrophihabitans telluris]UQX87808.1 amidase family protein [Jatrophihabitans telluris]
MASDAQHDAVPTLHTIEELAALLAAGTVSALGLLEHYLDRIVRFDPALGAILALDETGARAAAQAADDRRARGLVLGRLDGIPVLVKDNIEAIGLPGTAGSRALLGSPPVRDAGLVTRLRAAGAVIFGSTNLSEWANFRTTSGTSGWSGVRGQANNPYDVGRNPSGSSSGSAVAVAAALSPVAIGTETDGSIVSPAGLCGVVGFKPSRGTVPGDGIVPISSAQDIAGPITRSVADARTLYEVLSDRPIYVTSRIDRAPVELDGLRVAVWTPDELADEPAVRAVLDQVADLLRAQGSRTFARSVAQTGPFEAAEFDALLCEFATQLPAYLRSRPGRHPRTWPELLAFDRADPVELSLFGDENFALAAVSAGAGSPEHLRLRAEADEQAARAMAGLLDGCDVAVTVMNRPAWHTAYGHGEDWHLPTSSPAAVSGCPSLSLPAGLIDGLPVGVLLMARVGEDARLLSIGQQLEALLPPRTPPADFR